MEDHLVDMEDMFLGKNDLQFSDLTKKKIIQYTHYLQI